jgi:hypothetical protein
MSLSIQFFTDCKTHLEALSLPAQGPKLRLMSGADHCRDFNHYSPRYSYSLNQSRCQVVRQRPPRLIETFALSESGWRGGLTQASICYTGSIHVYSNAVFTEIGSFKNIFSQQIHGPQRRAQGEMTYYQLRGSNRGLQTWMHYTQER